MKYFTPELWLRTQSGVDPQTFLQAYDAWERGIDAYEEQLQRIIPRDRRYLHLRRFALQESLHDAVVQGCWFATQYRLNLLVRPEAPAELLVLLEYTLVGEPIVNRNVLPQEFCASPARWLYDEFALLEGAASADEPVFTHNILLGNGCELIICFRRFEVSRHHALLPDLDRSSDKPLSPLASPA
jgi:hypothetical protein